MDPTIIASIIGAGATVVAAIIALRSGRNRGHLEGYKEGKAAGIDFGGMHSIERFMDIYKENIDRAVDHLESGENDRARNVARGFVDNVKVWRDIQENFSKLLNGLVNDLDGAIVQQNDQQINDLLFSIREAYQGKRAAIETQLARSKI